MSGGATGGGTFNGECHWCRKPGNRKSECQEYKRNLASKGKAYGMGNGIGGGKAWSPTRGKGWQPPGGKGLNVMDYTLIDHWSGAPSPAQQGQGPVWGGRIAALYGPMTDEKPEEKAEIDTQPQTVEVDMQLREPKAMRRRELGEIKGKRPKGSNTFGALSEEPSSSASVSRSGVESLELVSDPPSIEFVRQPRGRSRPRGCTRRFGVDRTAGGMQSRSHRRRSRW